MILLIGALSDSNIAYLIHRLMEAKAKFALLDPRQHGLGFQLEWETSGTAIAGRLRYAGRVTPLAEVRSAYVHNLSETRAAVGGRRDLRPGGGADLASTESLPAGESSWMLHQFLETTPALVCNRPSAEATNYSKTWQQQAIGAHGFRVPRTLVTNVPAEARRFYQECRQRVIYKSLSARRSIVRRLTAADLKRLDRVRACPTQFQEWVPGVDVRVHVIGRRLFPTEIITDATDYRYSAQDGLPRAMRSAELPAEVGARCLALAASFGLVTAGVDLRRHLDGGYYCLEVNPRPGFMFYQQYTGQRIGDALVDTLLHQA
jgi:glutathione synthase/RimK-type ligase-like ATP-grasp enzyme